MSRRSRILAERVRRAREAKGWSPEELARAAGVPPRVIREIESGEGLPLNQVAPIARALGVSAGWLVYGVGRAP